MTKQTSTISAMSAVLWLCVTTACGSGEGTQAGRPVTDPAAVKTPSGEATAEEVARELRGSVRCPAKASADRPSGAPVDDVVGVRPGMAWDEAVDFVLCDNPLMVVTENRERNFDINTYGQHIRQGFDGKFAEPRVVKSSRDYLREMSEQAARISGNAAAAPLPPGQSRFYVSTMGMPGQERVLSVAREEYFVEGTLPTVDAVRGALVAKYGEPSQELDQSGLVQLWWMYDTSGRKFADGACQIGVSPDAGTSLSTGCGISVGARIQRSQTNAGLAQSLAVSAQDGARGYEVLQQTEAALRVGDAQRKARELENASKNATAPKL